MNRVIKTPYSTRVLLVLALALLACCPFAIWSAAPASRTSHAQDSSLSSIDAGGHHVSHQATGGVGLTLPLSFEANSGQTDPRVTFLARGQGYTVFLTSTEAVLALQKSVMPTSRPVVDQHATTQAVVRLQFVGANPRATVTGRDELPGKINYFMGSNPRLWRTGIATYAQVAYANLYPGVTLVYYGTQRQLEYDFIVAPQSDPRQIGWSVSGAQKMWVDGMGNLRMIVAGTELVEPAPSVYQMVQGVRQMIHVGYVVTGNQVRFDVGTYNPTTTLVIDPILSYSTYLGGSGDDFTFYMDLDSSGNVYLAGFTNSTNFPTTAGAVQTAYAGGPDDVFVTKLNPTGSGLVFSTYLGGAGDDIAIGVATDPGRNVYVVGTTSSTDFPTTPGAFQRVYGGGPHDGFVTKLNATGSALVYSTYLGGSGDDQVFIGPTDASGQVYAEGFTSSPNFPTTHGAFQTSYGGGNFDAFVTKLNRTGTGLVYSTYLGGTGDDFGFDGTIDSSGHAYLTGFTSSTDFPTTVGAFQRTYGGGNTDLFVTKLNQDGTGLVYSTYLGGSGDEQPRDMAVDQEGNAYVPGLTSSTNFPTTAGAFQTTYGGGNSDGFVTKLNPTGSGLVYSTYLGGSGDDIAGAVRVDSDGNAYVPGQTGSTDFPTTADALQSTYGGGASDAFVVKLNRTGSRLLYSTYLGGSGDDGSNGSGVGINQGCNGSVCNVYVNGFTNSVNFPTTAGAFQRSLAGGFDVFSIKLTFDNVGDAPGLVRRGPASGSAPGSARQSGNLLSRAELLCRVSPLGCLPLS